jgi:deazaflavin-dependent oxidoreductase (nitroreductase family)
MYKLFTSFYVWLYRVSGGRIGGTLMGFNVLLLHTVGRKSGEAHITPLGYFAHDGGYVIVASNAGSDKNPGWYYNVTSKPQVDIEIGGKQLKTQASVIGSAQRPVVWQKIVTEAPNYGAYEYKTKREIPLILLKPV